MKCVSEVNLHTHKRRRRKWACEIDSKNKNQKRETVSHSKPCNENLQYRNPQESQYEMKMNSISEMKINEIIKYLRLSQISLKNWFHDHFRWQPFWTNNQKQPYESHIVTIFNIQSYNQWIIIIIIMKKKQREIKVLEIIIQYIPLTGKENNKSLENRPV